MIKHLTKHGNSYALIIDRGILDLLRITPKTPLSISTDGERLVIVPANEKVIDEEQHYREAVAWIFKRYDKALRKLAE